MAALALTGCDDGTANNTRPGDSEATRAVQATVDESVEPSRVELERATAVLDDLGIVRFTIHYRFTSGVPVNFYQCDITFPGTERYGIKPMTASELSPEGSFQTGIEVGDAPVQDYTITLSEAISPDRGYKLISNTLEGTVAKGNTKQEVGNRK